MAPAQPVTRRELRRAEQSEHSVHAFPPVPRPVSSQVPRSEPPTSWTPDAAPVAMPRTDEAPAGAPVTRRALRDAERRLAGHPVERLAPPAPPKSQVPASSVMRARHSTPELARAAHRAPVAPSRRRPPSLHSPSRRSPSRRGGWSPLPGHGPAVGLLMAVAFVLGAVTSVQSATAVRVERAEAAAVAAEEARVARVSAAAEARLTGQVMASAAALRTQALDTATQALAAADALLLDAGAVVGKETTDPLVEATARLQALVERAPDPEVVLGSDTPAATAVPAIADDAVTTLAATAAGDDPVTPVTTPSTPDLPAELTGMDAPTAPEPDRVVADSARVLEALDGETNEQLLAVAEEVTALIEQVRQAAEDAEAAQAAAAQAAAAAEAARVAAEQAAVAELARKIAAADAAPNGDIPTDLLCGVSFDAGVLLRCDAAADFERLNAAFRDHFGRNLAVSDSYRTYDEQVAAKANRGDLAATPGTSNHGRGLAVDLDGFGEVGQFDRPYYVWMAAHARDYGWLHPSYMGPDGSGPLEPWHWEYRTD